MGKAKTKLEGYSDGITSHNNLVLAKHHDFASSLILVTTITNRNGRRVILEDMNVSFPPNLP
jgi:hypothetical protein